MQQDYEVDDIPKDYYISVDISHTSVAESIKLDAMGMCDVCDVYVRMYVVIPFFLPLFPHLPLLFTHAKATRTNIRTYIYVWI